MRISCISSSLFICISALASCGGGSGNVSTSSDTATSASHVTDTATSANGADSGWVLLDYGDVIVHIFSSSQREFYSLEQLWAAATPIVRLQ